MCLPKPFSSSVPKRDAAAHFRTLEPRTALTSSCSSSSFAFKLLAAAERKQDVCSFDEKSGQTEETERRESGISHAPSWKWLNTSEEGVNALHCKCKWERTEDYKLKFYSICVRRSLVVGLRQPTGHWFSMSVLVCHWSLSVKNDWRGPTTNAQKCYKISPIVFKEHICLMQTYLFVLSVETIGYNPSYSRVQIIPVT